jgi:hypothetical protein
VGQGEQGKNEPAVPRGSSQGKGITRQEAEKNTAQVKPTSEKYYKFTGDKQYAEAIGKPVSIEGHKDKEFFVHSEGKGMRKNWIISEGQTGLKVGSGETQKLAIENAKGKLDSFPKQTNDIIKSHIEKHGISPRYAEVAKPVEPSKEEISAFEKVDLETIPKDLEVDADVIREKTGEIVKVKRNAREAMTEIDDLLDKYKRLIDCLKAA